MTEECVSFELAKKLKEKGFREKCLYYYTCYSGGLYANARLYSDCCCETIAMLEDLTKSYNSKNNSISFDAPTISQVLKWLRKEHGIHIEITSAAFGYSYIISKTPEFGGMDIKFSRYDGPNDGGAWNEWEYCASAAIEYVIDNLIEGEKYEQRI